MEKYTEKQLQQMLQEPSQQRKAFECIVHKYTPQLYWLIRRMVYSHDDADDVLQNTFLKAWSNLSSFRGDSKLSTWLYRIATNEALSFLQHKRETLALDSPEASILNTLECDPYFDGDQTQKILQQALATLPDKQRLVFNLKYYEEMKYEDMSQFLETSVGALKASYHFAVQKIEAFFREQD